jgi:hypothetical protein
MVSAECIAYFSFFFFCVANVVFTFIDHFLNQFVDGMPVEMSTVLCSILK